MEIQPLTNEELEKMIGEEFIERAKGRRASSWEGFARSLKYAADILYEKYKTACHESLDMLGGRMDVPMEEPYERDLRLVHTYYLLAGYSIENLVKGIILIRRPVPSVAPVIFQERLL